MSNFAIVRERGREGERREREIEREGGRRERVVRDRVLVSLICIFAIQLV